MWTKELRRHKGRSAATATAVAVAAGLLVAMLSISAGIISTVESSITEGGADLLVAAPYDTQFPGAHTIASNLTSWPNITQASPILSDVVGISSGKAGTHPYSPVALGVVPADFFGTLPPTDRSLLKGEFFSGPDDPYFDGGAYDGPWSGEVVLSDELARNLSVSIGDSVEVAGDAQTRTFRVVGTIATQLSSESIIQDVKLSFFRLSELQALQGKGAAGGTEGDLATRITVTLEPAARLAPGGAVAVRDAVESAYPDFAGMVQTKQDRLARLQDEYAIARIFYVAIGFVSLSIGLLFVACVMMISVSERTRDIGILRAMGVSRRSIFVMVLGESVVLVALGAAVAVAPGYYGAQALGGFIATSQGVAPTFITFSAGLVAQALMWVVAFGVLAALYPAWKATRVPVVDAMRAAI